MTRAAACGRLIFPLMEPELREAFVERLGGDFQNLDCFAPIAIRELCRVV